MDTKRPAPSLLDSPPSLQTEPASTKSTGSTSQVFRHSKKISQGMKTLNSFGFKTSVTHADPSLLLLFRSHLPFNLGFHVSDLWSQRQQQEFLKTMKLERAQMARERQAHFINYLAESRKKLGKSVSLQELQEEIERGMHREAIEKYIAAQEQGVRRTAAITHREAKSQDQLGPQTSSCKHRSQPKQPRRLVHLDDFIGHCKSTLKVFKKKQEKLGEANRQHQDTVADDIYKDSAISLRISCRKKFVNPLRK